MNEMTIFDQVRQAMGEARATLSSVDRVAGDMASMLRGRLRHVPGYILVELKRELRGFDAHKKEWKK